jgi:hypothetical protein
MPGARWPHRLTRACTCLLIGAMLSLASGYTCSLIWQQNTPLPGTPRTLPLRMVSNTSATHYRGASVGAAFGVVEWVVDYPCGEFGEPHEKAAAPAWTRFDGGSSNDPLVIFGYGWPLPIVSLNVRHGHETTVEGASRITLDSTTDHSLYIPYRILWGNLALNTPLFAASIAGVWWLIALRRRARRRGRCTKCGYPRTGLAQAAACPECGAAPEQLS